MISTGLGAAIQEIGVSIQFGLRQTNRARRAFRRKRAPLSLGGKYDVVLADVEQESRKFAFYY